MITCSKNDVQRLKQRINTINEVEEQVIEEQPWISILENTDLKGIVRKPIENIKIWSSSIEPSIWMREWTTLIKQKEDMDV